MSWIETHTGKKFDFANLEANDINILDIAHALSNICRFTGHCREFYSVAEHCVVMSKMGHWRTNAERFEALMHDAHEAYIGDMSAPLKFFIPEFKSFEKKVEAVVRRRFGLPEKMSPDIKAADLRMLAMEAEHVMRGNWQSWESIKGIQPAWELPDFLTPEKACIKFLMRFAELFAFTENTTNHAPQEKNSMPLISGADCVQTTQAEGFPPARNIGSPASEPCSDQSGPRGGANHHG